MKSYFEYRYFYLEYKVFGVIAIKYCLQGNIRLRFIFAPFALVVNGEFQCLKLFLFKHNCVWANSRRDETAYKKGKITRGENNTAYSSHNKVYLVSGVTSIKKALYTYLFLIAIQIY